jgi:hypothetical protein
MKTRYIVSVGAVVVGAMLSVPSISAADETSHRVSIGTRVSIQMQGNSGLPDAEQIIQKLLPLTANHRVWVQRVTDDGRETLLVDLWGSRLEEGDVVVGLRQAFPALNDARITFVPAVGDEP